MKKRKNASDRTTSLNSSKIQNLLNIGGSDEGTIQWDSLIDVAWWYKRRYRYPSKPNSYNSIVSTKYSWHILFFMLK